MYLLCIYAFLKLLLLGIIVICDINETKGTEQNWKLYDLNFSVEYRAALFHTTKVVISAWELGNFSQATH